MQRLEDTNTNINESKKANEKKKNENPRVNVTSNKYDKHIQRRRAKVHELLVKGYSQKEIAEILEISQPTASRDISFIKKGLREDNQHPESKMAMDYFIVKEKLNEINRNLWQILDNKKTKATTKLKAIKQLADLAMKELELIPTAVILADIYKKEKDLEKWQKEIMAKEKIIEAYRKGLKLSWSDLRMAIDAEAVF